MDFLETKNIISNDHSVTVIQLHAAARPHFSPIHMHTVG